MSVRNGSAPAVLVEDLTKRYADFDALAGLSFEVPYGEIFGFVGPNGAGKTTTFRILATLLEPSSGRALIDGIDVTDDPYAARDHIGYMPDFFGVYDRLTAWEYLAFYARCYDIHGSRVDRVVSDLLELVRLEDRRNSSVDTLSRGMKQRLCLARALVHDPKVLLLDEPASGLDPLARVELRELLRELREMGKTTLISSHILPELTEVCTSFGIIDHGRILASGALDTLQSAVGARRVRVRVVGDLDEATRVAEDLPEVHGVRVTEDIVEITYGAREAGDVDAAESLLRSLMDGGVRVRAFTPVEEDLETAFLRVMGTPGRLASPFAEESGAPERSAGQEGAILPTKEPS
jgi:ABC-2 type transport system ATP-binding protein